MALSLQEICITDHVDYSVQADWDSGEEIHWRDGQPAANVDYPRWETALHRAWELFAGQLEIRMVMEFGVQTHTVRESKRRFARYLFDCIHQVENRELWTPEFQHGRSRNIIRDTIRKCLMS